MPRTTLNLDEDVLAAIARRRRDRGSTLTDEVNAVLRAGLTAVDQRPASAGRFATPTFSTGPSLAGPLDDVDAVLRIAEGDGHR